MSELITKMLNLAEGAIHRHVGKKHTLLPVWHVMYQDGHSGVIGTPWGNADEKHKIFDIMRKTFRETQVIAYCLTVEAWASPPLKPGRVAAIAPNGDINQLRPSVMPDRVEVFIAAAGDGTSSQMMVWDIRRNKRGYVKAIIKREIEGMELQGTIPSMLN